MSRELELTILAIAGIVAVRIIMYHEVVPTLLYLFPTSNYTLNV